MFFSHSTPFKIILMYNIKDHLMKDIVVFRLRYFINVLLPIISYYCISIK